jgi:SpoVK/Ycf46/Vps4 family AAA+-type ATPase
MYALARRAVLATSRTRIRANLPSRRLQPRFFHTSATVQNDARPPERPKEADAEKIGVAGRGDQGMEVLKAQLDKHIDAVDTQCRNGEAHIDDGYVQAASPEELHDVNKASLLVDLRRLRQKVGDTIKMLKANASHLGDRDRETAHQASKFREFLDLCEEKLSRNDGEYSDLLLLFQANLRTMDRLFERIDVSNSQFLKGRGMKKSGPDRESVDTPNASDMGRGVVLPEGRESTAEILPSSKRKPRSKQTTSEAPQLHLPDWFYERNILLHQNCYPQTDVGASTQSLPLKIDLMEWSKSVAVSHDYTRNEGKLAGPFNAAPVATTNFPGQTEFYLDFEPYVEICAAVAASFALSTGSPPASTQILNSILYCTFDGGTELLKSVLRSVANELETDVLRLNMHDLAALSGVYQVHQSSSDVQQLGSISLAANEGTWKKEEKSVDEEDNEAALEQDTIIPLEQLKDYLLQVDVAEPGRLPIRRRDDHARRNDKVVSLTRFLDRLIRAVFVQKSKAIPTGSSANGIGGISSRTGKPNGKEEQQQGSAKNASDINNLSANTSPTKSRLIICLEDFKGLSTTPIGLKVIQTLGSLVGLKREKYGDLITIVGITSSSQLTPNSEIQQPYSSSYRTMLVKPLEGDLASFSNRLQRPEDPQLSSPTSIWDHAVGNETQITNLRNIREMLRRLLPTAATSKYIEDSTTLPSQLAQRLNLQSRVLRAEEIHRIALTAVGLEEISAGNLSAASLQYAMLLCYRSDAARASASSVSHTSSIANVPNTGDIHQRIQKLKPNKYEKELLAGVVFPEKIRTGFGDVHAAVDTIEALRTMTSLSMTRPDAFRYGILKSDSLSGLLMYGPPGTGKTMLARAVAKESGATVLNITASDVRHMFVGEAEKIVKAVFSLSQKLSPCIVFIDEADSLLAARSQKDHSRNHRDTINQFLLEWDGLTESNVFLMIATNRPFDLDDAVLRRLPRRLLVDLPEKKDREAILSIHLKEEVLDEAVSLADLAERTPFYSGSDLKNVVVSAALACVKGENEMAAKAKAEGVTDHRHPARRTLTNGHFEKALQQVSASVSGDMPSLKAIRKFDQQYGERRGRKPKPSLGFVQEWTKERSARIRDWS